MDVQETTLLAATSFTWCARNTRGQHDRKRHLYALPSQSLARALVSNWRVTDLSSTPVRPQLAELQLRFHGDYGDHFRKGHYWFLSVYSAGSEPGSMSGSTSRNREGDRSRSSMTREQRSSLLSRRPLQARAEHGR